MSPFQIETEAPNTYFNAICKLFFEGIYTPGLGEKP